MLGVRRGKYRRGVFVPPPDEDRGCAQRRCRRLGRSHPRTSHTEIPGSQSANSPTISCYFAVWPIPIIFVFRYDIAHYRSRSWPVSQSMAASPQSGRIVFDGAHSA